MTNILANIQKKIDFEYFLSKLYTSKSSKYSNKLQKRPKFHTFRPLTYKIFTAGIENMGSQQRSQRCGHTDTKKT